MCARAIGWTGSSGSCSALAPSVAEMSGFSPQGRAASAREVLRERLSPVEIVVPPFRILGRVILKEVSSYAACSRFCVLRWLGSGSKFPVSDA